MFFFLSKVLGFLLLPSGILLCLGFAIYFNRKNHTKVKMLSLLIICLTYLFCSQLLLQILSHWEHPQQAINKLDKKHYAVVLTGGMTDEDFSKDNNLQLGTSADRLWQTLYLYQLKKIEKIIISGGDVGIFAKIHSSENDAAFRFLLQNGVPENDIIRETESKNTYENAHYTSKMLSDLGIGSNGYLVTSAYHMRRAMACFDKSGLPLQAYPADHKYTSKPWDIYLLIPQARNFRLNELIMKEIIGYYVYKAKGYL